MEPAPEKYHPDGSHLPWPRLPSEANVSYTVLLSWAWIVLAMLVATPGGHRAVCSQELSPPIWPASPGQAQGSAGWVLAPRSHSRATPGLPSWAKSPPLGLFPLEPRMRDKQTPQGRLGRGAWGDPPASQLPSSPSRSSRTRFWGTENCCATACSSWAWTERARSSPSPESPTRTPSPAFPGPLRCSVLLAPGAHRGA